MKVLEQQLESEHEERINFMREKHELETKIILEIEIQLHCLEERDSLIRKGYNIHLDGNKA